MFCISLGPFGIDIGDWDDLYIQVDAPWVQWSLDREGFYCFLGRIPDHIAWDCDVFGDIFLTDPEIDVYELT